LKNQNSKNKLLGAPIKIRVMKKTYFILQKKPVTKFLYVLILLIALSASCNKTVEVINVLLTPETVILEVNKTATLTATVIPEDATNKTVRWESSKPQAVEVDHTGKITAFASDTAIITVTTVDGNKKANCIVIVKDEVKYPIDIPFEKYSLAGTSCLWEKFEPNKAIIINSDEEMENYVVCTDDTYPQIDFSKQSLILTRSNATPGIRAIDIDFVKNTVSEYVLSVILHVDGTAYPQPWRISIITPKMGNEETIVLNVQQTY
jgi:hypothetical protein